LKYFGTTDLASNAQFYVAESYYMEKNYQQAVAEYDKLLTNYPKSFKLAPDVCAKDLRSSNWQKNGWSTGTERSLAVSRVGGGSQGALQAD